MFALSDFGWGRAPGICQHAEEGFDMKGFTVAVAAVLVASHGPFTWGRDATRAVDNAEVLEYLARMEILVLSTGRAVKRPAPFLVDAHYLRKHGPGAYYGQPGRA